MSCTSCGNREPSRKPGFHFLTGTAGTGHRVAEILTDHGVGFERVGGDERDIAITGLQNRARIVALLRQILSGPERGAVSVLAQGGGKPSGAKPLEEWWRVHETGWFKKATAEDRFVTWFQPIIDTAEQRVIGHECLIRLPWGRIYGGAEILEAAKAHDEIHAFDAYARSLAIQSAARQATAGTYFVNFMPSSIYNPEVCLRATLETVQSSGLQPRNIVFEVVGSKMVRDRSHLHSICDFFRNEGFGLALDDLGTGTESFQMVCDLKPDFIKLERSLVRDVERPVCAAVIRKLVELADRFKVTIVAKGVERTQVMEDLWLLGVQSMQGYLFGRPAPGLSTPQKDPVHPVTALHLSAAVWERSEAVPAMAVN